MPDRTDVPGYISRLLDFVNTYDFEDGSEDFAEPGSLTRWLVDHGLLAPHAAPMTAGDLKRALELREALREAMAAHHDSESLPSDPLDELAREIPLRLSFAGPTPQLQPLGSGAQAALAEILVSVAEATAAGSWTRLKVCPSDTCRFAFYDTSKNRSRTWCSMDVCGNRAKTKRYRSRRKSADSTTS